MSGEGSSINSMPNGQNFEIRDLRNGDWYWIHKAVIRHYTPKVGTTGIAVYNLLTSMANSSQGCFPSQKYIAECLGCSRTTVNKTLKVLEKNGLVKIERRSRYHCVYRLLKVRCKARETQMLSRGNSDVQNLNTNNNKLTRNIE
jgi:biotin operon repressor